MSHLHPKVAVFKEAVDAMGAAPAAVRGFMDHVDQEIRDFNVEMQVAGKAKTISIATAQKWLLFAASWALFYKEGRPADLVTVDDMLWQLTGAYESDLYHWRETYLQETGNAPKSRFVFYGDVLSGKEKPFTVDVGPPYPIVAGIAAVGALFLWSKTRGR